MDAGRFDALSRSFATRRSRRFALKSLGLAGAAAAFGAEQAPAASGSCALHIFAKTSAGPHKNTTYTGTLHMEIGEGGAIDSGTFDLDDGSSHPLVGQTTGRALNLRVTLATGKILELNGTADIDLLLCRGAASGTFGGPGDTDIGTWRTGTGATTGTTGGGSTSSSGSSDASGNASTTSGNASGDTTGGSGSGGESGSGGGNNCDAGQSRCDGQCVDLQTDLNNCGRCGFWCASGLVCTAGVCVDPGCGNDPATGAALALCTGICVNTGTDPTNCGACDHACITGAQCVNGACTCAPDGSPCTFPNDCCGNLCGPSGICGCVPAGAACNNTGECCDQQDGGCVNDFCAYITGHACAGDSACFSGFCQNGVCADRP
jgi:hypothetical protein